MVKITEYIWLKSQNTQPLLTGFLNFIIHISFKTSEGLMPHVYSILINTPLSGCMKIHLFGCTGCTRALLSGCPCPSTEGHLVACKNILSKASYKKKKIPTSVSMFLFQLTWVNTKEWLLDFYGEKNMLSVERKSQTAFQNGWTSLHSCQLRMWVLSLFCILRGSWDWS